MKIVIAVIIGFSLTIVAGIIFARSVFEFVRSAKESNRAYQTVRTCQYLSAMNKNKDWKYQNCLDELEGK